MTLEVLAVLAALFLGYRLGVTHQFLRDLLHQHEKERQGRDRA